MQYCLEPFIAPLRCMQGGKPVHSGALASAAAGDGHAKSKWRRDCINTAAVIS